MPAYRLAIAVLLGAGPVQSAPAQGPSIAFVHATVIDVERGRALPGMTVLVEKGGITAVGADATVPAPRGARVIDATGKYLSPGLWDMHVHAAMTGLDSHFLPLLVANGITGVREMFSRLDWMSSAKSRVRSGELVGPRIVGSGHILDGRPAVWQGSVVAATADEATHAVDSLARGGADFIKVYSRLSPEAFFAAAREAKARGLPFAGHVPALVSAAEASDSGQRSIEHLTGIPLGCSTVERQALGDLAAAVHTPAGWDSAGKLQRAGLRALLAGYSPERCKELAARFVRNGTWMVPTIQVLHSVAYLDDPALAKDPRMEYIFPGHRASWDPKTDFRFRMLTKEDWANRKALYARQLEIITLLHQEGVKFLAGTDLSNPFIYPGFSLHDELAALVQAGFTPAEALRAATIDPARYLGAADSLGSIATGKRADLVLLEADPLADIRNTTRIAAVVADGRFYDSAAIRKLLDDGKARARAPKP
jgi:imidazolonepropionase-like amidohydrolase